jgi:hypothetical protein
MLFTVFQYIPLLEEEIHASKTLSKKSNDSSKENDMDDDADPDGDDDADELFHNHSYSSITLYSSLHKFRSSQIYHFHASQNITTPPPKI